MHYLWIFIGTSVRDEIFIPISQTNKMGGEMLSNIFKAELETDGFINWLKDFHNNLAK